MVIQDLNVKHRSLPRNVSMETPLLAPICVFVILAGEAGSVTTQYVKDTPLLPHHPLQIVATECALNHGNVNVNQVGTLPFL